MGSSPSSKQHLLYEKESNVPTEGSLILKYSGDATDQHTIDAEFYARSLLGFGKSFKKANRQLLGIDSSLSVKAERAGSVETLIEFFSQKDVVATAVMLGFLQYFGLDFKTLCKLPMLVYKLLIDIIKKSKGKKEDIKKKVQELQLERSLEEKLLRLLENNQFRRCLDDMTLILELQGIECLEIKQDEAISTQITKKDRPYFVAHPEDEVLTELDDKVISITYLSPEKSKWQFKSGASEFWAVVEDQPFLEEMQNKALEEITELLFVASVEKTTIKEANTKQVKVSRTITGFRRYEPPKQGSLLANIAN